MDFLEILIAIIIVLISFIIGTLIFWGLGNLVIYVFKIDYTWTILHGLVVELVWWLITPHNNGRKE